MHLKKNEGYTFFIVGLAFFVLPQIEIFQQPGFGQDRIYENLFAKLVLFLLFFPNVAVRIFGNILLNFKDFSKQVHNLSL
jgi:hypothetical protein